MTKAGVSGADDSLRPIGNLQLAEDVGDVVAYLFVLKVSYLAIWLLVAPVAIKGLEQDLHNHVILSDERSTQRA